MIADRPPIIDSNPPPPRRRPKRREKRRGTKCLNCFTPTTSRYCPECGQENVPVNISLWEIFREAIEEFVRFDSKLIRTLIPVIFSPGKLTREWAAGRRTDYLSPLKLYLTVTAIFFLILPRFVLQDSLGNGNGAIHISSSSSNNYSPSRKGDSTTAKDKVLTKEEIDKQVEDVPALIRYPVAQLTKLNNLNLADGQDAAKLLVQTTLEHFPTALFAMLPMYAAVLWILYVRNRRYYVEHLVFALHCHAFYFVILTLAILVRTVSNGAPATVMNVIAAIWIPVYSFAALKLAYQQGWIKTAVKWFMLGFSYMILLSFAMVASLVMAAADMPDAKKPLVKEPAKETKSPESAKPPTNSVPPKTPPAGEPNTQDD